VPRPQFRRSSSNCHNWLSAVLKTPVSSSKSSTNGDVTILQSPEDCFASSCPHTRRSSASIRDASRPSASRVTSCTSIDTTPSNTSMEGWLCVRHQSKHERLSYGLVQVVDLRSSLGLHCISDTYDIVRFFGSTIESARHKLRYHPGLLPDPHALHAFLRSTDLYRTVGP
jgi:hypothetical protein